MARAVTWDGFFNTRDLGDLPTREGGTTRRAAFYRAADLRFVTGTGWAQARAAGLRTVIDLRNPAEIRPHAEQPGFAGSARLAADPSGAVTPPGITRVEVPLDDVDDVELWRCISDEKLDGSPLYYPLFLHHKGARCAALIEAIARTEPGGVLFHCGSGRDRAGLTALLLLSLADVEPEAIAADYDLSTEAVRPFYAALGVADQSPMIRAILTRRGTTTTDALLTTLDGFDARQYLLAAGASAAALDEVRRRLLTAA
ncbi:tyrosine-protein phosphatase [Amycolatopsis sp. FDAARGOS 1241]|uniref:tyrosine-protein phosphatase n=1 Tax=Amycolatopsis sp. FDAARGOS 1241 TaxID=2778070 RepID=UPI001951E754|nr:tyrosine-protein phosphatase [Amycolatopsis sp. FDAARGOS 1241]QRP49918.1 tyrosine-protein phosphatase [Amycolatopsis sp. FDAARGOS 1241]